MGKAKKVLSFQDIQEAQDLRREELSIPEWGGVVYIKQLSGSERLKMTEGYPENPTPEDNVAFGYQMVGACLVDGDGNPIMTGEQTKILNDKNPQVVERILKAVQEVNGLSPTEEVKKSSD